LLSDQREALFRRWVAERGGVVLKVARAYTWTAEDCQDLAQEIFLAAWRSLDRFEGRASPTTWFYRVALNTALAWQRDERRRRAREPRAMHLDVACLAQPDDRRQAEQRQLVEQLVVAIRRLPKGDAALVLLYLDGCSYREMSEVLGISENHVGVKLSRAKQALAALVKKLAQELVKETDDGS
jgi:RNA polymerase sigma-70 factor (ECF subfamily)